MTPRPENRHLLAWRPSGVLLVCGVWTALVLMSVVNGVLLAQQGGRTVELAQLVPTRALDWYSCALFTPLFVWCARRWPIERSTVRRALPLWLALTTAAAPAKFVIQYAAAQAVAPETMRLSLGRLILVGLIPEVIAFWAMAGVILSVEYHDRWREREAQAIALGRQLTEARLEALTAQLQPHFLFNTLQGISTLIHRDTGAADRMLGRLSELLRRTLHSADAPEVPLEQELSTLDHYLEIQRIRFADRLCVELDATAPPDTLVPHFILQPLVENAVHHGIARRAGQGTIRIGAHEHQDRLVLTVHDDGPAAHARPATSNGIGLANTRARLHALYGGAAAIDIREQAGGGFAVTLALPLRRAAVAGA